MPNVLLLTHLPKNHYVRAFELHAAPDALIDRVLHGGHAYRKNERSTVALTIRKMHAPNQLAAVLLVSGSPDENLL